MNAKIINEVNQGLQSNQLELYELRSLYGRPQASNVSFGALNSEFEALMTDDLAADDYHVVMRYDNPADRTLVLLECLIDVLKTYATPASSTTSAMGGRP
ncbi:hypothetical protein MRX96_047320 [Rhipicephalus microplus]